MRESIIKKYKMTYWIPSLVFIIGIAITITMVISYRSDNKESVKALAATNAAMYSDRMRDEIQKGVTLTESLKLIIQSARGGEAVIDDESGDSYTIINNFEFVAKSLMTDYISSSRRTGKLRRSTPKKATKREKSTFSAHPATAASLQIMPKTTR